MKILPLERRGLPASRLVLGCMPFGGGWNSEPVTQDDMYKAEQAVDAALSIGITMLDTADIYNKGKSEIVIGNILKDRPSLREKLIIQSKCGIRPGEGKIASQFDFSKEYILEAADNILQRLKVEFLDILLLHRPDPLMEPDEIGEAFSRLKASGKVRYFGVSNMNVSQMRFLQRSMPDKIAVNQLELSLSHLHWLDQTIHVNQDAGANVNFGEGIMEHCQLENIQIQAWGPLSKGLFSGKDLDKSPQNVKETARLVQQIARSKDTTAEAIVLAWLMKHPAQIQPVIGTTRPERIKACQDAENQSLLMTREEWYALYQSSRGNSLP